ncbi:MAG: DNA mismatch repair endonuclease MutL [Thermodesulfobacteriota bacterium]|nr:DNA mismatch repair endonuclease MutL [Thermodesulfobacteriota bacterium]
MARIRILPESLSNKIAAGEVVERPASVVKELMENAIDAKSTQVTVEVSKGGRALIRVSDNGIGMDRDDALLAIERHATSKVRDEKDLFSIATLGFRGEALPSIASVSDMEIVTSVESAHAGTRIVVKGGTIKEVSEVGAPTGTMISVKRLFFNTPARRKYLKTEQTELGHISDTVTRMALAWPGVRFRFSHNARTVANWGPMSDSMKRVADVLGARVEDNLYEVDYSEGSVGIRGFVASPDSTRRTSRGLFVFVNGRFVRDKVLHHAIMEGFTGRIMKGDYPMAVVFVTLPFDHVDVNVHPTKNVVRFQAPNQVHDTISRGISKTLVAGDRPGWGMAPPSGPAYRPYTYALSSSRTEINEPGAAALPKQASPPAPAPQALWQERPVSSLRIIGQLHNTYILCESEEGLVLVDQHAAHERVVFDALKAAHGRSDVVRQGMLIPERLELSHREADILEALLQELGHMGVDIEPFGERTYLVRSVPELLAGKPVKPLVMEIIEKVQEIGLASGLQGAVDEVLMIMACHGAIRANERLSEEEMTSLLHQLDSLDNATHCPHGRPTLVRQSLRQIEKDFRRIV